MSSTAEAAGRVLPFPGDAVRTGSRLRLVSWRAGYARRLFITDMLVLSIAVATAAIVARSVGELPRGREYWLHYSPAAVCVFAGWAALLAWGQSRDERVISIGSEEYQRVVDASIRGFGLLAVVALGFRLDVARAFLVVALPLGLVGLLATRWGWRRWLNHQHRLGRCVTRIVVLGDTAAAHNLAAHFDRDRKGVYQVVGVCVPGGTSAADSKAFPQQAYSEGRLASIPVLGAETDVARAVGLARADTVAVTATERLGDAWLHELAWELSDLGVAFAVSPGIAEIACDRLQITPAAAVPLLQIGEPQYRGATRLAKMVVDRLGAAALIILSAPLLLAGALAVGLTSRGPVFYAAERIGIDGTPFTMIKFRSMQVGADALAGALTAHDIGAGPLFKMRDDPRVTRVGAIMRRYSLDELPQLFNVLLGQMSLVGPRPPLRCEVETYTGATRRRLLVRPGITGLWQVSGRSDLPWDEAVRLDLSYVENWSFMGDVVIIWKTLRAVITAAGSY